MSRALQRAVDGRAVYRLGDDTFRESLARRFLRDVEVGEGILRAILGVGS